MTEYNKNVPDTIRVMFDSIAGQYDRTNALLSFNLHKRWNKSLIDKVIVPSSPKVYLDLCCGTGAISLPYLEKAVAPTTAYLLDFSPQMLNLARARAESLSLEKHTINYLQADAQEIPLEAESVDCITIAYGIRNVKDSIKCFKEVERVLRPGGAFGILELTEPSNALLKCGHSFYLRNILPLIGKAVTSNEDAYRYLCNSIRNFISPETMVKMLSQTAFQQVYHIPLMGGVATLFAATKRLS